MARNVCEIRAEPEDVFAVLVDPYAFGSWVVGPDRVVTASDDWPSVDATFTHETGWGPLRVRDETVLEELDPPRRLVLRAQIRPIGVIARIDITLQRRPKGTLLVMDETPIGGTWRPIWNPVFDRLMWARNIQALERLKVIVEELADTGPETPATQAEEPGGKTVLGMVTGAMFWGLSTLRGKRFFHPVGGVYEAELVLSSDDVPLAEGPGPHRAIVRFSKGVGLPGPLPDVHGLAIKIPDAWGRGADQDLLLVTSGHGPLGRHVLRPATSGSTGRFSSILPYEYAGRTLLFGACRDGVSDVDMGAKFGIEVATGAGAWHRIGTLTIGSRYDGEVSFDPWNSSPGLVPTGMLNALRRAAYQGSREGRDAPEPSNVAR